jgi:hypothetical protein
MITAMTQPYRLEALALHAVGVFDDVRLDFKPIASADAQGDPIGAGAEWAEQYRAEVQSFSAGMHRQRFPFAVVAYSGQRTLREEPLGAIQ